MSGGSQPQVSFSVSKLIGGGGKAHAVLTIHLGGSFEKHKLKDGFFLDGYAGVVRAIQRFPPGGEILSKTRIFQIASILLEETVSNVRYISEKNRIAHLFSVETPYVV